jgi:hypothetical protein
MKTHAIKENRILKSVDFVLIVLTTSFVTFIFLKSMVPFPDWSNHPVSGASQKVEFPVSEQKAIPVSDGNTTQETSMINADRSDNGVKKAISEKAGIKSGPAQSNAVTAIKEVQVKAARVHHSVETATKSKNAVTTPVIDSKNEKLILENWIKDRDEWEQK